ncbi:hypothetical protein [Euzebya tangerina]|uniref:hypothetical protein n=1 Tax=Euzebya tangerina TaxID=591198 RepID=UPI000E3193DB|nr:hypothetical protein [Euzebya tangerina]
MEPANARKYLGTIRMGLGALWLTPRVGARFFGLEPENDGIAFLARLFAARDLALGAALLQASGADVARQVDLGIMVDSLDLAAVLFAALRKDIGARTLLLAGTTAGAAIALGLMGRELDS